MKINRTPVTWAAFFITCFVILAIIPYYFTEPREVVVDKLHSTYLGLRISKNEEVNKRIDLVSWPAESEHSRLGIAHFIWHPEGQVLSPMSFNGFIEHLAQTKPLPPWLDNMKFPPWTSQEDFESPKYNLFKSQLSYLLQKTTFEQAEYLIMHLDSRLPVMLEEISNPFTKMHVHESFYHMVKQYNGVYAMADYLVFQGDGTELSQRYNKQGWGLLQVLDHMSTKKENPMKAFTDSAELLLTRRVSNAPSDESAALLRWKERLKTYHVD